jgi:hypothetical protein
MPRKIERPIGQAFDSYQPAPVDRSYTPNRGGAYQPTAAPKAPTPPKGGSGVPPANDKK